MTGNWTSYIRQFRAGWVLLLLMTIGSIAATAQSNTFIVTVDTSTAANPYGDTANADVFYIDGVEAKELTLERGTNYRFVMSNVPREHKFYISTSRIGGGDGVYSTGVTGQFATLSDTLFFTPGIQTPNLLYYQCTTHTYMGGRINIVDSGALAVDTLRFRAHLAGDNEVPAVETHGSGNINAMLIGDTLVVSGSFSGLSSEINTALAGGAHLHIALAGLNGPVAIPLKIQIGATPRQGTFLADSNRYILTAAQRAALLDRRMYVNVHSLTRVGGELRGQLVRNDATVYTANLTGRAEFFPNMSSANGNVLIERYGDTIVVSGSFAGLQSNLARNIAGGAHIHIAPADTNGPVIFPLVVSPSGAGNFRSGFFLADSNRFVLSRVQATALDNHGLYVNVHSDSMQGGEIRGQIVPDSSVVLEAWLAGMNEVSPKNSTARGAIIAILSGNLLELSGSFRGLESNLAVNIAGGSHIHRGTPAENGPIVYPLTPQLENLQSGLYRIDSNTYSLGTQGLIDSLLDGMLYVNVHSEVLQGGEVRGQILASTNLAPDSSSLVVPGANVMLPTDSTAQLEVRWTRANDPNGNQVVYYWQIATSADFGTTVYVTPKTTDTAVSIPYKQLTDLLKGAGIDISQVGPITVAHRVIASDGSLWTVGSPRLLTISPQQDTTQPTPMQFVAVLDGQFEVPAAETRASGMVRATLTGDTLRVLGDFSGLKTNFNPNIAGGAHIHTAPAGTNGPVAFPLQTTLGSNQRSGTFAAASNTFVLNAAQKQLLMNYGMYVNIHSMGLPTGELRGQLVPDSMEIYWTNLSGRAEIPGNLSKASGSLLLLVGSDSLAKITGSYNDLAAPLIVAGSGSAHLHNGRIDENGPVLQMIVPNNLTQNNGTILSLSNPIPVNAIDSLLVMRKLYANFHTTAYPGGEIRGQFLPTSSDLLEAWLAPHNEVTIPGTPLPKSSASGSVIAILESNRLMLAGSFHGLTGAPTAAHIHGGGPNVAGSVVIPLTIAAGDSGAASGRFMVASNTYTLTASQVDSLMEGLMYVNVHTASNPNGEIRGQLLVSTNVAPGGPQVITPAPIDTVNLDSTLTGTVVFRTNGVTDPNGNQVAYRLEISSSPQFNSDFTASVAMTDTAQVIPYAAISLFVDSAGINLGVNGMPIYARVVATDGSLRSVSPSRTILVRRVTTGVEAPVVAGEMLTVAGMVPNPTADHGAIRLMLGRSADLGVELFDAKGEHVASIPVQQYEAGEQVIAVDVRSLQTGAYFFRITAETPSGEVVRTGSFTVVR